MTFTFVCQACDDSFDVDYAQLTEGTKGLKCPNCNKRLPAADLEELVTALDDVLSQVSALKKRFAISFDVDAEDLPAPYDTDRKRVARGEEDEEEEEDEADEDDELGDEDEDVGEDDDEDRF